MSEAKDFPTDDVLSTVTGYFVSINGISGVYNVLNWMTGESIYTHQISRISKEAAPVILAAHPNLAAAYEEAKLVNQENWRVWRRTWINRYGPTISVPKFTIDQHERIDPLSELVEKVHPDKIITL